MQYGTEEFSAFLIQAIRKGKRHDLYEATCEHAEEMSWHIYGEKPVDLLGRTRPNEPEEVKAYRLENYEPTTKSSADKAIQVVSKIFNPNLSSIRWEKENSDVEVLKKYTREEYPVYNDIVSYMKDVVLRMMLADPNGVMAATLNESPETDTVQVMPILKLYGSENIWNYDYEHFLIFLKEEQGTDGNKWFYFEYYDKFGFVSFRAYVSPNEQLFTEDLDKYDYDFEQIPVWHLGGKTEAQRNGKVIYKSFFDAAVPFWNLSIIHNSDLMATFVNHIYPQKYELSEPCDYKWVFEGGTYKCNGGQIKYGSKDGPSQIMDCPNCSGTGYRNMAGPNGVYKISKEKLSEGDTPVGIDPVGYINVPIDAATLLKTHAADMKREGMWAINMEVEDEVGAVQSGVAKTIDRSAQYDMLFNIGTVVFKGHIDNAYYFFDGYMFPKDTAGNNLPQVNQPTNFDVYTTADLINNFKVAKDSGIDPNLLQIKQQEILTRDLTTNPDLKEFAFLMLDLDPLPGLSDLTISANVAKGFNRQVDAVIHFNIKRFLERAYEEDKTFYQKPRKDQIAVLEKYGNEMVSQNKPKVDQSLLYANNQNAA